MRGVSQALIFVTGRAGEGSEAIDWAALAATGQPIVLYMGLAELPNIAAALMAGGLPQDEPVAVIASATLPGQRILVTELARAAEDVRVGGIKAPAIIVIGAIVRLRAELEALALRVPDLVAE
jgi:uroporphyrin-III C-methyltransferase